MTSRTPLLLAALLLGTGPLLPAQDSTIRQGPTVPLTGKIARGSIPNEYLEVTMARGAVQIVGTDGSEVEWDLAAGSDGVPGLAGPARIVYTAGYPGLFTSTAWQDRLSLDVGAVRRRATADLFPDLRLRVPKTLRLIQVRVRGAGRVDVRGFAGEINVVVDSGGITGSDLLGSVILEARQGGVTLDLSSRGETGGSVNLLAKTGPLTLVLGPRPSAILELSANCGAIHSEFPLGGGAAAQLRWQMGRNLGVTGGQVDPRFGAPETECGDRPREASTQDGTPRITYLRRYQLGAGAANLHASVLLGDIVIRRSGGP